jgi:hypothetical protein
MHLLTVWLSQRGVQYNIVTMDQLTIYRHQSIRRLFLKIYLQENFLAFICHPSRGKCIHLQTGGGGGGGEGAIPAQKKKLPPKVSDGKKINYSCAL